MARGMIIALALSLAANVFLGGYVVGKSVGGKNADAGEHPGRDVDGDRFDDLPPAARASLKAAFLSHRATADEGRARYAELHRSFMQILSAEKFDRAAAEAVVDEMEALGSSARAGMTRLIVEAAAGLSLEDRIALARHFESRRHDHRRGHGGDRRRGDGDHEGRASRDAAPASDSTGQ